MPTKTKKNNDVVSIEMTSQQEKLLLETVNKRLFDVSYTMWKSVEKAIKNDGMKFLEEKDDYYFEEVNTTYSELKEHYNNLKGVQKTLVRPVIPF